MSCRGTLTRLAALGTLSRSAGEGPEGAGRTISKPLSCTAGEGGPSATRWVGEGRRNQLGFTLVELLVVMVIIALLMTAVPSLIAGLPGVRLRAAADEMAERLKRLHGEALRRGATMALIVDPAARTYRISTDNVPHPLPEVVDRVNVKSPRVLPADGTAQVRFFADGTATAATVRLRHGQRSAAITVDWLTGRVRRDD